MPLSESDVQAAVTRLQGEQDGERDKLNRIRRYWKGKQPLPLVVPTAAPREVREMAKRSRVNVCDIVVDTMAQSLFVDGFRGDADHENVEPWAAWQANKMDRRQSGVHRAAVAYGASYVLVLPGDTNPRIRGVSPRRMTAMYGEDPDWPELALERRDASTFRLYDDEAVYFVTFDDRGDVAVSETSEHGFGVCPVVRFLDQEDLDADDEVDEAAGEATLGQIAPLTDLQDQIDMTTFGLMVAQHYSAFRQRYILGWVAETEKERMQAAASQLWTFDDHPDDVKLGEFSETDLSGYIKSREEATRYAATLSQTPVHEMIGQMVNLSAEALAAAEAGKDRKVDERKTSFGESWEQVFQLAGSLMGAEVPDDSQAIWRDTSARAFQATVDALGKLAEMLEVPPQELWERVPGTTQQDIERWKQAADEPDSVESLQRMLDRQAQGEPSLNGG